MFVDTTIYGYTKNGAAYCPACAEKRGLNRADDAEIGALFAYDREDARLFFCDDCFEWLYGEPESDPEFDERFAYAFDVEYKERLENEAIATLGL